LSGISTSSSRSCSSCCFYWFSWLLEIIIYIFRYTIVVERTSLVAYKSFFTTARNTSFVKCTTTWFIFSRTYIICTWGCNNWWKWKSGFSWIWMTWERNRTPTIIFNTPFFLICKNNITSWTTWVIITTWAFILVSYYDCTNVTLFITIIVISIRILVYCNCIYIYILFTTRIIFRPTNTINCSASKYYYLFYIIDSDILLHFKIINLYFYFKE